MPDFRIFCPMYGRLTNSITDNLTFLIETSMRRIALFIIILLLTVNLFPSVKASPEPDSFSVIQLSDTQYLSESSAYENLTGWIADHSAAYNLRMVIHTGDIVDTYNSVIQWEHASQAMMILQENNIPYCWCAGNHDSKGSYQEGAYVPLDNYTWLGSSYDAFNISVLSNKAYWVSSCNNGKSTAATFTFKAYHFLVISIEYLANETAIQWMKNLIESHSSDNIIVSTHSYLDTFGNTTGGWGTDGSRQDNTIWGSAGGVWETSLRNILMSYPSVFMILCGHMQADVDQNVNGKEEIMFGDNVNSVRIYTFNMTSKTVNSATYRLGLLVSEFSFPVKLSSFSNTAFQNIYLTLIAMAITVPIVAVIILMKKNLGTYSRKRILGS
jgi:hypothetical protein